MDVSGAELLAREANRRRRMGGGLYFYFMKDAVYELLDRGGYLKHIGKENIFGPKDDVIGSIYKRLDSEICRASAARIFPQCQVALPNGEARPDRKEILRPVALVVAAEKPGGSREG